MTAFSAVIASYNQRERLLQALESVRQQTYPAHEIIVVDDGSTDGTPQAVSREYPDVQVIVQENRGKGIARNRGAFRATGDWICFLDHDDLWHPEKLQAVHEHLEGQPDAIAIDHGVWIFREDECGPESAWSLKVDFTARTYDEVLARLKETGPPKNDFGYLERLGNSYEASLRRIFSTTSALCLRRDTFFIAGGFSPSLANGEDWSLSVNVARLGEWHTIPRALSCQRVLPDSGSTDPAAGLMILSSLTGHWYGGRPLSEHTAGLEFSTALYNCSSSYRQLAQGAIWNGGLYRHRVRVAGDAVWFAMLLLPRWRDRLYAMLPPPITWRIERRIRPWPK